MYNEAKSKYQEEKPMKDQNCGYCMRGELLDAFGIYLCDLSVSTLILFREQSHPGRCIVAYKDHVSEIVNISDEERSAFFADVARAAKAIHAAFHPDKGNYGASPIRYFIALQIRLDLFDHGGILFLGQISLAGVHRKYAAPLILILIFWNKMEMQMMTCITICTIIYLIWMEQLVHCLCHLCNIFHVSSALLWCQFNNLAHMLFMCHDNSSRMTLLLK